MNQAIVSQSKYVNSMLSQWYPYENPIALLKKHDDPGSRPAWKMSGETPWFTTRKTGDFKGPTVTRGYDIWLYQLYHPKIIID